MEETKLEQVVGQFHALYEISLQVDDLKDDIKELNKAAKDLKLAVAEDLEISPKAVERAYKDWVFAVENPELYDEAGNLTEMVRFAMGSKKKLED